MRRRCVAGIALAGGLCATPALARTVSGNLYYQDHLPTQVSGGSCLDASGMVLAGDRTLPPGLPVQVKVCSPACSVVATTSTSSSGYFAATISDALAGELRISVQAWSPAAYVAGTPWFDLVHGNIAAGSSAIALPALSAPKDNGAEQLNVLDVLAAGYAYAAAKKVDPSEAIAAVKVTYPGGLPEYKPGTDEIVLPGPSQVFTAFEDGVILHEYGHHLQAEIGSLFVHQGLYHGECVDYGLELGGDETQANAFAWKEGFATYFAEAVRTSDPERIGNWCFLTRAGVDAAPSWCNQSGQGWVPNYGRRTEWGVYATLFDLHDAVNDDRTYGLQTATPSDVPVRDIVFRIFDTELDQSATATPTMLGFANAFLARNHAQPGAPPTGRTYLGSAADLDRILYENKFFTLPGGVPLGYHALPDYKILQVVASPNVVPAGGSLTISAKLENPGFSFHDESVYLVAAAPAVLGYMWFPPFTGAGSGASWQNIASGTASWATEGVHSVQVTVDSYDRIPEQYSINNYGHVSVYVYVCGNGACYYGEDCYSCPQDCGSCSYCGDGSCDYEEDENTCPGDCGIWGPPQCFVAGTQITMADGSTKAIESVAVGDRVLSYDTDLGQLIPGDVTTTFVHPESKRLVVLNGDLVTTAEHPFYSSGAWVRADALAPGDPLVRATFAPSSSTPTLATSEVSTLEALPGHATTYNFEVARVHNYFAGGVLVHNIKPGE